MHPRINSALGNRLQKREKKNYNDSCHQDNNSAIYKQLKRGPIPAEILVRARWVGVKYAVFITSSLF